MTIQDGIVVGMHYTLKNDSGDIVDTSQGHEPLVFIHGFGNIISGLEAALVGKSGGDTIDVSLEPDQAYGVRDEDLRQEIKRSDFEGIDDIQVGMTFQAETDGDHIPIRVIAVDGDKITVDGNHELAGTRVHFSVSIKSLREADAEEIQNGQARGTCQTNEGGCQTGCCEDN